MSLLVLWPRPNVSPEAPVDALNPFSASVTIINGGAGPLWNVGTDLTIRHITYTTPKGDILFQGYQKVVGDGVPFRYTVPSWNHKLLWPDQRYTISLAETDFSTLQIPHEKELKEGKIGIVVSYQPYFLPHWCHWEKEFLFKTVKQTNGQIYWYSTTE